MAFAEKYRQLQNLRLMADKTGAVLLRGANKIESFRQVVRNDLNHYYQLSYYPPKDRSDRAYHKIEVKVPGARGIQVRFREGYSDAPAEASIRPSWPGRWPGRAVPG
jgi:hypothetical protein